MPLQRDAQCEQCAAPMWTGELYTCQACGMTEICQTCWVAHLSRHQMELDRADDEQETSDG